MWLYPFGEKIRARMLQDNGGKRCLFSETSLTRYEVSVYPSSVTHTLGMPHWPFSHCLAVLRWLHPNTITLPSSGGCLTPRQLTQKQNTLEFKKQSGVYHNVMPVLSINQVIFLQFSLQICMETTTTYTELYMSDKANHILVEICFKIKVWHMAHIGWIT